MEDVVVVVAVGLAPLASLAPVVVVEVVVATWVVVGAVMPATDEVVPTEVEVVAVVPMLAPRLPSVVERQVVVVKEPCPLTIWLWRRIDNSLTLFNYETPSTVNWDSNATWKVQNVWAGSST